MIDEDWSRPVVPAPGGIVLHVVAVVPMPGELGGAGEILALSAFGSVKLPLVEVRTGESIRRAASRAVLQMAGVGVRAERLLYVIEQAGRSLTLAVLCSLEPDEEPDERPGVRFVPVVGNDGTFEPSGIRELLVEDVHNGFVRPAAWATLAFDEYGREAVDITW